MRPAEHIEDGFEAVGGLIVYWRRYVLRDVGRMNANHKHPGAHWTTFENAFRVYAQGEKVYDVKADDRVLFPAHKAHQFENLEPFGAYVCRHDLFDNGGSPIPATHGFTERELRAFTRTLIYHDKPEKHDSVVKKERR